MTTKKEFRVTARFEATDQHGHRHTVTERTEFLISKTVSGRTETTTGDKKYLIGTRPLIKLDDDSFETVDGASQLNRL